MLLNQAQRTRQAAAGTGRRPSVRNQGGKCGEVFGARQVVGQGVAEWLAVIAAGQEGARGAIDGHRRQAHPVCAGNGLDQLAASGDPVLWMFQTSAVTNRFAEQQVQLRIQNSDTHTTGAQINAEHQGVAHAGFRRCAVPLPWHPRLPRVPSDRCGQSGRRPQCFGRSVHHVSAAGSGGRRFR